MASQGRGGGLRGRDKECAQLRTLIATVRSGSCQVLVLRGEAGVGKTALLDYACAQAGAFRCVRVAGVESDMELAYAGVQQLCAPLMEYLDDLPTPQRDALNVAFGLGVGPPPDRFLVGLAVLSLVATAAAHQPLLCVIDDAQWLDQVSVQTLGFVARRVMAEPVALLFAARDGGAEVLKGLPQLVLRGLSVADARALMESVMIGGIDPRVRDRVVAETRGNPLALLEVPRSFSTAELAGGFWRMGKKSPGHIEQSFIRRVQELPGPTRHLLLTAAAEPVGDSALFLRAAANLGIAIDALGPAEEAGVIEFGPRMRFLHPLMRSAAYRSADPTDRRAAHRALADATDPQADPDRKAWHAANAAAGTTTPSPPTWRCPLHVLRVAAESQPQQHFWSAPRFSRPNRYSVAPGRWKQHAPNATPRRPRPRTSCWPSRRRHRYRSCSERRPGGCAPKWNSCAAAPATMPRSVSETPPPR